MMPTLLNIITEVQFTSFEWKEFFVIEGMSILPFKLISAFSFFLSACIQI